MQEFMRDAAEEDFVLASQVRRAVADGGTYASAVRQVARRNRVTGRTIRRAMTDASPIRTRNRWEA
jgi:hypothetical protein